MDKPDAGAALPWVAVALIWMWGLVPHAVGQVRARLTKAERELKRADARLCALENRAAHLHKDVRQDRERRHGVESEPSQLELDLASHLAEIVRARQDVQTPAGDGNGR